MNASTASSDFRRRFISGKRLVGSFIKTPTVHATEIFGLLGFDFVVIDEEHAPIDRATTDMILLAARAYGVAGLVRVSSHDPSKLLSALDCGAAGVLVPHVDSVSKAQAVAAAGRYRGGRRGYSGSARSGAYTGTPMWQVVDEQDAGVSVIGMIEDPEALDSIDSIAAVDGIQGFFIGRGDLTVALNAKTSGAPEVRDAVKRIVSAVRQAGKPVCVMVGNAAETEEFAALGATAFIIASDQSYMRRAAATALADFRKLSGPPDRRRMMYHSSDPRAALAAATSTKAPSQFAAADFGRFYEDAPAEVGPEGQTWLTRGQNFLVAYSKTEAGSGLQRTDQPDEYVLLIPDAAMTIDLEWNGQTIAVPGPSITFVPAGTSTVRSRKAGVIVRVFTTVAQDLAARCSNAQSYAQPHPNVTALVPWPAPTGGPRVRTYSLDVAPKPGRFGRIFRGSSIMINFLDPRDGRRDPTKMSPHHHDDFEQGSLALAGSFTHLMRWPWTPDMTQWRPDEAAVCDAPSLCVIPPPAIHTSQSTDPGRNQLVDIFCPPRLDFSSKPGWVLNADDYPMPSQN